LHIASSIAAVAALSKRLKAIYHASKSISIEDLSHGGIDWQQINLARQCGLCKIASQDF
jgi:hypothetical protein